MPSPAIPEIGRDDPLQQRADAHLRAMSSVLHRATQLLSERVQDPGVKTFIDTFIGDDPAAFTMQQFAVVAVTLGCDPARLLARVLTIHGDTGLEGTLGRRDLAGIDIAPIDGSVWQFLAGVPREELLFAGSVALATPSIRYEYELLLAPGVPKSFERVADEHAWWLAVGRLETIRIGAGIHFEQFVRTPGAPGGVWQEPTDLELRGLRAFATVLAQTRMDFRLSKDGIQIDTARLLEPSHHVSHDASWWASRATRQRRPPDARAEQRQLPG